MKLFNFYCSDYDGGNENLLLHNDDKSQEEFEKDCRSAMIDVSEEFLSGDEQWLMAESWVGAAVEMLIDKYGYTYPNIISYGPVNGGIIGFDLLRFEKYPPEKDDGWKAEIDRKLKDLSDIVGKSLLDKVIEKNRQLDAQLDK